MNKSRHYVIVVASIIHYRHSMSRTLENKKEKKENCRKLLYRKDLGLRGGESIVLTPYVVSIYNIIPYPLCAD
jgi:hypothetical protein